jgi:hypothetical protein
MPGMPKVQMYGTVLSGLCHSPPQMKNQHGLNEEKILIEKIIVQFFSGELTCVGSLDTDNQAQV